MLNNINSNHNFKNINNDSSTKIANNANTNIEGISLIHEPCVDYIIDIIDML